MTGSLRIKHKTYYMVFSWKDELGQWRQKSESTGIPERGGKRKAQKMLNNRLAELQAQSTAALTVKDVPFLDFGLPEKLVGGPDDLRTAPEYFHTIPPSCGKQHLPI